MFARCEGARHSLAVGLSSSPKGDPGGLPGLCSGNTFLRGFDDDNAFWTFSFVLWRGLVDLTNKVKPT